MSAAAPFPQPLGHSAVQAQLAQMLGQGQLPHTLLLHGPRGVGKATLARWLAARLICGAAEAESRNPLTPNKNSAQWAQLQAQSCPDFYVLTPEEDKKSIGIKAVQTLLEKLQRSADTARVVVLDCTDDLTPEAANTLLKTLEEPRPGVFFILVAHQLEAVLPTIRSRSRLIKMGLLSEAETAAVLATQGAQGATDTEAAALAHGAPGWWLGQSAAQRAALNGLSHGTLPSASTPGLMPLLLHHLATLPPSFKVAQVHQTIAQWHAQQQALNLPAAMVHEQALNLLQQVWGALDDTQQAKA